MQKILKIINHRDFVLSLAIIAGLLLGESTYFLSEISLYTLMLAMISSTIDFSFKAWKDPSNIIKPITSSFFVSYILFGGVAIIISWLVFYQQNNMALWAGFVLLAAAPPGPAVIPFSGMLNGDKNYSTAGLFGLYIAAMIITPAILFVFLGTAIVSPYRIFIIMAQLIIVPLIISRFFRHPKVLPHAQKVSGTFTKWMLFLVLTPIVGMNRSTFFDEPYILLVSSLVLAVPVFLLPSIYNIILIRRGTKRDFIISSTFMLTIKSAVFSAVVAFRVFEDDSVVAIPAAVMSVYIVLFAVIYSQFVKHQLKN